MKKRASKVRLTLHRETLQSLELPEARGGASFNDTLCGMCNTQYSLCIFIACGP